MYVETTKHKQDILGYTNKQKEINKRKKRNKEYNLVEKENESQWKAMEKY